MCTVVDLDLVCFVCVEPYQCMHPIFATDGDESELKISEKISILSELKVERNNKSFPSKICSKCLHNLRVAWRFRKKCQMAATIYQTVVKLEDVQRESSGTNDLVEKQIKVPHVLYIKCITIDDDKEGKKDYKCLNIKKNLEDASEFHKPENSDKIEQDEVFENDDDSTIVEYNITDNGAADKRVVEKKHDIEEYQTKPTTRIVNINERPSRGRERNSNMIQKEVPKSTNIPQTKSKKQVNLERTNSSEKATKPEVNQIKTIKPKLCEICGNSFRYQNILNAHMRRHYNDKPFRCEYCDKTFVTNVDRSRHMRVHTGQKPYPCQYCGRCFAEFGTRMKHERTHTGERPYHCVTCGKSFAYLDVLSVHMRTHTGEKRFSCTYCTEGFTKRAYLISHVNRHHSGNQVALNETMDRRQSHLQPKSTMRRRIKGPVK